MAVVKSWSGDGLTAGTLTTSSAGTGDTPFQSITGTALTVDASGTRSPQIKVTDGTGLSYAAWTVGPLTNWAVRFYVTQASSSAFVFQANDSAGDKCAGFDFNTAGNLRLSAKVGGTNINLWVATAAFPLNTRMRVEYTETSAGAWTSAYYTGDSATAVQSSSGTKTAAQSVASVWAGRVSGAIATSGLFLDDLAVASFTPQETVTPIGPAGVAPVDPVWFDFGTRKFELVRL